MANQPALISFRENTLAVTRDYITQPRISELEELRDSCFEIMLHVLPQGGGRGGGARTMKMYCGMINLLGSGFN